MAVPYLKRVIDPVIASRLKSAGAVLVEGAKWCGKTRTSTEIAASVVSLMGKENEENIQTAASIDSSMLLSGPTPRLIDEWQVAPALWNAVRKEVDERSLPGQFILTGSAVPPADKKMHSGTGRIVRVRMRPMSLFESGESAGTVSIKGLFDGAALPEMHSELTVEKLAFALSRGGWPAAVINPDQEAALQVPYDYVDAVVNEDVSKVNRVKRNPTMVRGLMRSLARNTGMQVPMSTIKADMIGDRDDISKGTIAAYLNALQRIFVIEDAPAWNPSLRSKTAVRTSPTRYFTDPSLAVAVLGTSPDGLRHDYNTFGLLFESLCVRDLRVYAQPLGGEVYHYRDKYGLEADAVVVLRDGRWGAIEVKMGANGVDLGAENLKRLRDKVNTEKMREPSFLMVLTATEYGYRRDDGVLVVPIGCLRD